MEQWHVNFPRGALIAGLLLLLQPLPVLGASFALQPADREYNPPATVTYRLTAQDVSGLGGLQFTFHYPQGILNNPQVTVSVSDSSVMSQSNTQSPGIVRLGMISATGMSYRSRELARINFDLQPTDKRLLTVKPYVHATDLQGRTMEARIQASPFTVPAASSEDAESANATLPNDAGISEAQPHTMAYAGEPDLKEPPFSGWSDADDSPQYQGRSEEDDDFVNETYADELPGMDEAQYTDLLRESWADDSSRAAERFAGASVVSGPRQAVEFQVVLVKQYPNGKLYTIKFLNGKPSYAFVNGKIVGERHENEAYLISLFALRNCRMYVVGTKLQQYDFANL